MGLGPHFRLQRTYLYGTAGFVAGGPGFGTVVFTAPGLPAALNAFIRGWDLFFLHRARVRWIPRWDQANGYFNELPQIAVVPEYDGINPPTSFDQILGFGPAAKMTRFDREITLSVNPQNLVQPYVSSGSTQYGFLSNGWNNSANLSLNLTLPLASWGVTAMALVPGTYNMDIYIDIDMLLAKPSSG